MEKTLVELMNKIDKGFDVQASHNSMVLKEIAALRNEVVTLKIENSREFSAQRIENSREFSAVRKEMEAMKLEHTKESSYLREENSREFSALREENSREFSAVRKEMEAMKLEHTKESSYVRIELEMIKNKIEYSRRLPARKFTRRSSKSNRK